jgi:hypothetical protein
MTDRFGIVFRHRRRRLIQEQSMHRMVLALLCVPTLAFAQVSEQSPMPLPAIAASPVSEIVLIPRGFIPLIEQAILHPHSADVGDIVALLQQLDACVADNPQGGVTRHDGPDRCPVVTQALAAKAQELADAKKAAPGKPN